MAVAIAFFLVRLFLGLTAGLGVPWLVIVSIAVVLAIGGWFGAAAATGTSPRNAVRRTQRPRLLGPGGPDDPDRPR
jgi:hypothetical protein